MYPSCSLVSSPSLNNTDKSIPRWQKAEKGAIVVAVSVLVLTLIAVLVVNLEATHELIRNTQVAEDPNWERVCALTWITAGTGIGAEIITLIAVGLIHKKISSLRNQQGLLFSQRPRSESGYSLPPSASFGYCSTIGNSVCSQ